MDTKIKQFCACVWDHYAANKRDFSWRQTTDPYYIIVSEIMLQQTQTQRVQEKIDAFVELFPTWQALASAQRGDVIVAWQGLGYNRRAAYLHASAQHVAREFACVLPHCPKALTVLPGIGINTAGAICAYAFNMPTAFIETNIRTVFIYHFFPDVLVVSDAMILEFVQKTVCKDNPREWYYALMDYGVHLKKTRGNIAKKSKHYAKQSAFIGSMRQIRGSIIRILSSAENRTLSRNDLIDRVCDDVGCSLVDCTKIIKNLASEELITIDTVVDCVHV